MHRMLHRIVAFVAVCTAILGLGFGVSLFKPALTAAGKADFWESYSFRRNLNSTTGVEVALPKDVDSVNEYRVNVELVDPPGADVGTIYITKGVDRVTVYNTGANTSAIAEVEIVYGGLDEAFSASSRGVWYVTAASDVDHATDPGSADSLQDGRLADVLNYLAYEGISEARVVLPGPTNYQIKDALTIPAGIVLQPEPGAVIVTSFELDANGAWTESGDEYVYTGTINEPSRVTFDGDELTLGTVSSLAEGEWGWSGGQLYVHLSGDRDPDTGLVEAGYTLTINGGLDTGLYQIFSGEGIVTGAPGITYIHAEWFGAAGDDSTDDTHAFECAIALARSSGVSIKIINSKTYKLTRTLDLNNGSQTRGAMLHGEGYNAEATLKFYLCNLGLKIKDSKSVSLKHLKVDMTQSPMPCVGILANGLWSVRWENVIVLGPDGTTEPTDNHACIGILLRSTYGAGDYVSTIIPELDFVDVIEYPERYGMGVYRNAFERIDIAGFSYGLFLAGREGVNIAVTQSSFISCKVNNNYHDVWLDGIGGGITFVSCTAEGATGDAVRVERVADGTGPVWIGGELSGNSRQWVGPGLLLTAVSGTSLMNANDSGETGTLMRFTNQGAQLYGTKLNSSFISDWNTKQDVPLTGSGDTSSKTMDIATFTVDGTGTDASVYEISCVLVDNHSPQGTSCLVYHLDLNRAGGQSLSAALTQISTRTVWHNLGGGTVAPTLSVTVDGNTATVAANLNWDGLGNDPGESNVSYSISEMLVRGTFTVAGL